MAEPERCLEHQIYMTKHENALVDPVEGPVARLAEWDRQHEVFPDSCLGIETARYTLFVRGDYIVETGKVDTAEKFRAIALELNQLDLASANAKPDQIVVYRAKKGRKKDAPMEFRWSRKSAANGKKIGASTEGYARKQTALDNIERTQKMPYEIVEE